MYVAELIYPGTWLDYPDREWGWRIGNQLQMLETPVSDAAVALALFEAERAKLGTLRHDRENSEGDARRLQEIEKAFCAQLAVDADSGQRWMDVRELSEIAYKREQWAGGRLPSSYERRLIFLHARSFLYALYRLDRSLAALANEDGVPGEVATAHAALQAAVPDLRGVRNSVAHYEDRSRRLGRGKKPLDLKPINHPIVKAPGGGVLMLENLHNNRFGSTMEDGHHGEVEVSVVTLRAATECVQRVLNAFAWKGLKQRLPY